jgi:anti-sigma-K factor RskA
VLAAAAAIVLVVGAAAIVRRDSGGDEPGDRVAAVLEDPDNVVMPFAGELSGLSMIYSADAGAAVLSGSGVAPPEGTDVYELWHFDGETPVRVETFVPDGTGVVTVYLAGLDIAPDARFAITIEPAGGTEAPTGPVVGDTAEV